MSRPIPLAAPPRARAPSHFALVVGCSLVVHLALFWSLRSNVAAVVKRSDPVRVTIVASATPANLSEPVAPVAVEAPAPSEPTQPAPRPREQRGKREPAAPATVSRPLELARPVEAEPADFTGVTLTSESGAGSWASVTGNGEATVGALAAPPRGTHAGSGHGRAGSGDGDVAQGPRVLGLGQLSRPPKPPSLDDALLEHYPKLARDQGTAGHAVVRARILADGRVNDMRVLVASAPEFGRACERTLSGSRWSAPLDESGRPVATDVSYTCRFEVTR